MELKTGVLYDAIHKTDQRAMVIEINKKGFFYLEVSVYEVTNGTVEENEMISISSWDFYEIRDSKFTKDEDNLLEIQNLAVSLGNKDLFDKCNKDLQELGYGVS
jgi:hypothetical protein